MTVTQFIRAKAIIARVAKQQGISTAQCRAEMIEAIRAAWATTDSETKDRQIRLVGEGREPTPEEFITIVSSL